MTSDAPSRRLPINDTFNLRDVGGYPVDGGGVTAWGVLYRADCPTLTVDGREALRGLGLRTVVDLRTGDERRRRPAALDGLVGRVVHRPVDAGALVGADPTTGTDLTVLYNAAVRLLGPDIAAAVTELGRPGALPALVHCAAGKDRTGIVVALVLSAAGVPDAAVAADYALTATYLTPAFFAGADPACQPADARWPAGDVDLTPLHRADPDAILATLAEVRVIAGSARGYLLHHGVDPTDLDRLVSTLVTPGSPQ